MAAALTQKQRKLLSHPPGFDTWVCGRPTPGEQTCAAVNPRAGQCWLCGGKPTAKRKRLYPEYLAACKAAGIEPGSPWPPKPAADPSAPAVKPRGRKR